MVIVFQFNTSGGKTPRKPLKYVIMIIIMIIYLRNVYITMIFKHEDLDGCPSQVAQPLSQMVQPDFGFKQINSVKLLKNCNCSSLCNAYAFYDFIYHFWVF